MLTLLLTIAFIAIWILPFYRKVKPGKIVTKKMIIGFLVCTSVGVLVSMLITGRIEKILGLFLSGPAFDVADLIAVAIFEELVKLFIAVRCTRKLEHARSIDYVLIFGMVGAGFEFMETGMTGLISSNSFVIILLRSVLAGHIFYLYFSGLGYAAAMQSGNRNLFYRNAVITMIAHFVFDLGITVIEWDLSGSDMLIILAFAFAFAALAANIVLLVMVIKKVNACCRESIPQDTASSTI